MTAPQPRVTAPTTPPPLAAVGLAPDTPAESVGGATGRLWRVETDNGPAALRLYPTPGELAAMQTAREAGLPVPELLTRAENAALFSWLPGRTLLAELWANPGRADELGRLAGAMQRRVHAITAPAPVRQPNDWLAPDDITLPPGDALLHLDWHVLNLLVDDTAITGILDWENARRGAPVLDLARTHCLMTAEPTLETLAESEKDTVARFAHGWADAYGPEAASIPAWARGPARRCWPTWSHAFPTALENSTVYGPGRSAGSISLWS
jgi:Ser/Thr protein kinase RdoA (MazF antagonist)